MYFLVRLLLVFSMCFQSYRGARGGTIRRIKRLITQRPETVYTPKNTQHNENNLIDLTPSHIVGSVLPVSFESGSQKQKPADFSKQRSAVRNNLVQIEPNYHVSNSDNLSIGLMNCQSIKNKANLILDTIIDKKISMMFLTETWLRMEKDDLQLKNALPNGYSCIHRPRTTGTRGGGVGLIFHNGIKITDKTTEFDSSLKF